MSREIKFRAWYEKDKQMIDWFSLTQNAWNTFRGEQPLSLIYEILVARKDDFNVMQYTGLKDKNGTEIFEGDITKDKNVIMWHKEKALFAEHFYSTFQGVCNLSSYPILSQGIEIIGNIHENPELLNQPI